MKSNQPMSEQKLKKEYFHDMQSFEAEENARIRKSEKRAWFVAGSASLVAVMAVGAVMALTPLKSVEPFVLEVDKNTGAVDVISVLAGTKGQVSEQAEEAVDKYWLTKYIRHREGYLWNTRNYDRKTVGLMSSTAIQQSYANYTNPKTNENAPVTVYSDTSEVVIKVKSISFLNPGKNGDSKTALVRYIKTVKKPGVKDYSTDWAATITFNYLNMPMQFEDRLINPLGFQVTNYRNDAETGA